MNINAIKSRLGSISEARLSGLPLGIQKLLREDLPTLLKSVTCAHTTTSVTEENTRTCTACGLVWNAKSGKEDWV